MLVNLADEIHTECLDKVKQTQHMTIPKDRYLTTEPPKFAYTPHALRNNSRGADLDKEALERFKIREICER
ncbi:hypothetical protein ASPCADRAFT_1525 [Aspergillus carbonarius ITEM 5010]|uniref:Uncharacterized protein n=1 Tax=Aspergillus carbonarius (strain ITEM 5010) TaxID=602072 RepID=A0A1R3RZE4_ASPC5|nr:hypothetical protein ASPCADRAFT_1525 [Aspergillus carbonarius ITEM 5010]